MSILWSAHLSRAGARHNTVDLCRQVLPFRQDPILTIDLPPRDIQKEHVVKRIVTWRPVTGQGGERDGGGGGDEFVNPVQFTIATRQKTYDICTTVGESDKLIIVCGILTNAPRK